MYTKTDVVSSCVTEVVYVIKSGASGYVAAAPDVRKGAHPRPRRRSRRASRPSCTRQRARGCAKAHLPGQRRERLPKPSLQRGELVLGAVTAGGSARWVSEDPTNRLGRLAVGKSILREAVTRLRRYKPSILFGVPMLLVLTLTQLSDISNRRIWGGDFLVTVWRPALAVIHGTTPYPPHDPSGSVYPPAIFLAAIPFTYLPWPVVIGIWQLFLIGAAFATLWILAVRDWRCYGIFLLSCPVIQDVGFGNATLLIVLLAACVWRFRDNVWAATAALVVAVTIKLLLAPMALWFFLRGRRRVATLTAVGSVIAILVPWAVIGFEGLVSYPSRLAADGRLSADHGASRRRWCARRVSVRQRQRSPAAFSPPSASWPRGGCVTSFRHSPLRSTAPSSSVRSAGSTTLACSSCPLP